MPRTASVTRTTKETRIQATWELDTDRPGAEATTGIGFLDHMLDALARHSGTRIVLTCTGDLHIDAHHTVEDVGIVLGQCLKQALGERQGIDRFGHMACPLDEALVEAVIDVSGRPWLTYELHPPGPMIGQLPVELIPDFFGALADQARIAIHLHQRCGRNSHHIAEAGFKAFARALRQAIRITGSGIPSTKGMLG